MKTTIPLLSLATTLIPSGVAAFSSLQGCKISNAHRLPTEIGMAKKMKNKQAELLKKMELAKQQSAQEASDEKSANNKLSDEEIKEQNDRKRFEELLSTQPVAMTDLSADSYLTKDQEELDMDLRVSGRDLLFEGDPAPTEEFNCLIPTTSEQPIGEMGAKRLVPWTRDGRGSDFLVVVCDPRIKSNDLREITKAISMELPKNLLKETIVISADSPAENRRFLKKSNVANIDMFSDESKTWMKAYTALGAQKLYSTMYIVADGRIQRIARDLDPLDAVTTIRNADKSYQTRSL
ncbi:unnamed protein product [Cylindrotheca closterium]|uniref:Alkyl hydroperoxide reductase subunit C/ Thiol specific antioxidant domain-containing protein n=1 Tax=Cylindrotheca closterium TaxID=2856 RepID=A0AAD2G6Q5_9STRA|nr:unnamed protein product [Cylindrotheca closterium]